MLKLDQIRAAESRLLLQTYDRSPILFVTGEGVHIVDENGTKSVSYTHLPREVASSA